MVTATKKNILSMPNFIWNMKIQAVDTLGINAVDDDLILALSGHPVMRKLKTHADTDLSAVDPQLLADIICKLESVDISSVDLSNQQVILSRISTGSD